MTQDAVVTRCLAGDLAEVVVTRATACGSNCASCEACVFQNELKTPARNLIGARPGQRVVIESRSSAVYGAIALTYLLPVLLALAGALGGYALGAGQGACAALCFLGFALGGLILVLSQRLGKKKDPITFDIVSLRGTEREVL